MQTEAQRLNDQSSASIKRSLAIAHQTNEIAADTMIELDRQGRQIENMERDIEIIEDNNKRADRQLRGLRVRKLCLICICWLLISFVRRFSGRLPISLPKT